MSHTPGPWTIEVATIAGAGFAPGHYHRIGPSRGPAVAYTSHRVGEDAADANAALISAAPDLLAVAEAVCAKHRGAPADPGSILELARAAVAKARRS